MRGEVILEFFSTLQGQVEKISDGVQNLSEGFIPIYLGHFKDQFLVAKLVHFGTLLFRQIETNTRFRVLFRK